MWYCFLSSPREDVGSRCDERRVVDSSCKTRISCLDIDEFPTTIPRAFSARRRLLPHHSTLYISLLTLPCPQIAYVKTVFILSELPHSLSRTALTQLCSFPPPHSHRHRHICVPLITAPHACRDPDQAEAFECPLFSNESYWLAELFPPRVGGSEQNLGSDGAASLQRFPLRSFLPAAAWKQHCWLSLPWGRVVSPYCIRCWLQFNTQKSSDSDASTTRGGLRRTQ